MPDSTKIAAANQRAKARGNYYRWLIQQYGNISLLELSDEPDPISLRQIFVPLRLDKTDIDDDAMPAPKINLNPKRWIIS